MKNYTVYHLHDYTSNCNGFADSCTSYEDYVKMAKKCDMSSIAFSNHGGIYDWVKKKQLCDKAKIKYIHGIELYMCINLEDNNRGYHIGLYAKNLQGVKELNSLISLSTSKGKNEDKTDRHFYYNPRISLKELMNTSDNIIITTACLKSALWQLTLNINNTDNENEKLKYTYYRDGFLKWLSKNKHRCFLEIQYHNMDSQIQYNKLLYEWSRIYNIPLIAGTDTHSSSDYKAECRLVLQKSKNKVKDEKDSKKNKKNKINNTEEIEIEEQIQEGDEYEKDFDLTWKNYEQLVEVFEIQNSLPEEVYLEAIQNTNRFSDMIENFELDRKFKYPDLYGDNVSQIFKNKIFEKYNQKVKNNIIDKSNKRYTDNIIEEFSAFKTQGMESFLLFMSELVDYCNNNNIPYGFCRGSVGGSTIAYILDIIDLDPVKWNTVFSRFCNASRVSLADIDIDFAPKDREKVYKFIMKRFGLNKTAYIAQFGTLQDRGVIDVLTKGLDYDDLDLVAKIKDEFEKIFSEYSKIIQAEVNLEELDTEKSSIDFDNHNIYIERIRDKKEIISANKLYQDFQNLKNNNKKLFYYFDGLKGTIISKGHHPAGMIGSPVTLNDNLGMFYDGGDENFPVAQCAMKAVDSLNFVKFDILGLKAIGVMKDAYGYIKSNYLKSYEINWFDKNVWEDMKKSRIGVFQFEGDYAFSLLKEFNPQKINDMSMINAAIRPSGKSYRDKLIAKEFNKNPSNEIDELLKPNNGFLIYQEDTIKFLTEICGFTGAEADNIRRCVDENTIITMGNGDIKKIKDIIVGEKVISVNKHGVSESKTVKNVFKNGIKDVYRITTLHGIELVATKEHKVCTQNGYKCVKDLSIEDLIMSLEADLNYTHLRVKDIQHIGTSNVYDIEVEDNHNYIANGLVVHNCIGKKDTKGLNEQLPKILDGYCKVSKQSREIAEEEAKAFLKIIEDSSEYQFGYNHSTGYSMVGYACTRLRTYYPVEFVTAYLNNADKKEQIQMGTELAKEKGITIKPIEFGHSIDEYTFYKEKNEIYKGINSIKYCNKQIANELYELAKNNKYNNFITLLKDIKSKTSVNSRQLKILTILGFFNKFGKNKKLLDCIDIFDKFCNVKQINKNKMQELKLNESLLIKYSKKETTSLYKEIDNLGLINELISKIENKNLSVKEQVKFEKEYLEYVEYINTEAGSKFYIVIEYETYKDKTKPYVKLRQIKTGDEFKTKIKDGNIFMENPFELYSILKVTEFKTQKKTKNVGGKWMKTDEDEEILFKYEVY